MKKTININIAGAVFNIEEDAYAKLDAYLNGLKDYFDLNSDREEIIADIEGRVAEHFSQSPGSSAIITVQNVEDLIGIMGKLSDFEKDSGEASSAAQKQTTSSPFVNKRLFRDKEGAMVAGVASGLGIYFAIDPVIIRIIFAAAVIFGAGAGILLYIILWIVMPEARTPLDKIEMRGEALSANYLREKVQNFGKNKSEDVKNVTQKAVRSTGGYIRKFFNILFRAVGFIIQFVFKFAGFIINVAAVLTLLAVTITFANVIFYPNSKYIDPIFGQIAAVSHPLYYAILIIVYILVLVFLIFLFSFGSLLRGKTIMSGRAVASLVALFMIAVVGASLIVFGSEARYVNQLNSLSQYQIRTISQPLSGFTKIEVDGGQNVYFAQGKNFSVKVSGRQIYLDRSSIYVNNGTLIIARKSQGFCLVCFDFGENINVYVVAPNLELIAVEGPANFDSEKFTADHLNLSIVGSGNIKLDVNLKTNLKAEIDGSGDIAMQGSASDLDLKIAGSGYYNGFQFKTKTAEVAVFGPGLVQVAPSVALRVDGAGPGRVWYSTMPTLLQAPSGGPGSIMVEHTNNVY